MLRLLSFGAGQDDIVLILHMDRKDHLVMNYAQGFDRLPIGEQENLALLFCNLFETASASEWLLYISLGFSGNLGGLNHGTQRSNREPSPEFEELQAQIDALRADQRSLEERRNAINLKEAKKGKEKETQRQGRKGGKEREEAQKARLSY